MKKYGIHGLVLGMAFVALSTFSLTSFSGCGGKGSGEKRQFLSMGTAPIGGAFQPVGNALSETLNNNRGDNNWKVQAKGTKGSQENIRRLIKGEHQLGLSNSAISYHAVRGEGVFDGKFNVKTVVTIAPNVAMFITKADSGIKTIADLKGKRVVCGPSGAGFDMFLKPLLAAHGVTFNDFTKLNDNQSGAVDRLSDGNADAAFLGGAVPTGSIQQACSQHDIFFIPFDEEAKKQLIEKYPFFSPETIPKDIYSDLEEDYHGLNVGSMHLITSADQPEEQIYQITKILWENRESITHPAAKKFITEKNAARYTGTDFHPGAIRFYKEIGIWAETLVQGSDSDQTADATEE